VSGHSPLPAGATAPGEAPRTLWRDDLIAALTGFLLITGLFVDGWNHLNLQNGKAGEFFTPWHGLLYAGFNACAIWAITRNERLRAMMFPARGKRAGGGSAAAPGLSNITPMKIAVLGMALVALGVVGDGVTRDAGLRASHGAMSPPFDFLLFTGAGLVFAVGMRTAFGRFVTFNRQVAIPVALAVAAAGIALFAFGGSSAPTKSASAPVAASSATTSGVAQVTPAPGVAQVPARAHAHGRATSVWTAAHRSAARAHGSAPAAAVRNDAPLTVAQTPSALPTTHQHASVNRVSAPVVRRHAAAPVRRRVSAPAPAAKRAHRVWTNVAVPDAPSQATQSVTTTTTSATPDTPAPASSPKPSQNSSPAPTPATSPTPAAAPKHGGPGQN
jgi:hypothetical protein